MAHIAGLQIVATVTLMATITIIAAARFGRYNCNTITAIIIIIAAIAALRHATNVNMLGVICVCNDFVCQRILSNQQAAPPKM